MKEAAVKSEVAVSRHFRKLFGRSEGKLPTYDEENKRSWTFENRLNLDLGKL